MIEGTISTLLGIQPFMGCLIQRCKIRWSEHVPTAGVRILPNATIEFIINAEFFYNLPDSEKVGLAWHEMLHLIMTHLDRGIGLNPKIANVAMDMDINQMIHPTYLPKGALLPSQFGFDKAQSFEVYYNLLKTHPDMEKYQQKKKYKGGLDGEKKKGQKGPKQDPEAIKKKIQEKLDELKAKQQEQKQSSKKGSKKSQQDLSDRQQSISERLNDMDNMKDQSEDSKNIQKEQEKMADEMKDDSKRLSIKDQIREKLAELDAKIKEQSKSLTTSSKEAQKQLCEQQKVLTERLEQIGMKNESKISDEILKTHQSIVERI